MLSWLAAWRNNELLWSKPVLQQCRRYVYGVPERNRRRDESEAAWAVAMLFRSFELPSTVQAGVC